MKIIGLMLTWNNLEFFRCALEQALSFCDEVVLVEGCHSKQYPKRSTDGTCEHIQTMKAHPKLRIVDFDNRGRYDYTQRHIRMECPKMSQYYKPDNWVVFWEDDIFFLEENLSKIKDAMQNSKNDALGADIRYFFYNFRFNFLEKGKGFYFFRIVDGFRLKGITAHCYRDGRRFSESLLDNMLIFHYGHVKRPERMKARWVMSMEKGTKASIGRFEKWMSVSWNEDEDIFNTHGILEGIRPRGILNVYNGKHPKVLDVHPWRNLEDVRRIK